jgi:dipeptidyl aminopeptidase/acylaminoacyl peptidase
MNQALLKFAAASVAVLLAVTACESGKDVSTAGVTTVDEYSKWADTELDSLADLSVPALRNRKYGSRLQLVSQLGSDSEESAYSQRFSADGSQPYNTYVAAYSSDGLRVTARVDVPATEPPDDGYPVVVFVHGWYGREGALSYDFMYNADSQYSEAIDSYVDKGFLVISPSLRGHGMLDGELAEGIEFLDAWDNGSYISPIFYAIDVLNLLDSLDNIDQGQWPLAGLTPDLSRIHLSGQSQGADAVLTALAVSGEGSLVENAFSSGSIWSGCFGTRFAQAEVYGPMSNTLEAFMSGDGSWTGTAESSDGSFNPNFVFGWPPDWIGTTDTTSPEWTWQADSWAVPTVAESLRRKYSEMYEAVNQGVSDINDAAFEIVVEEGGKARVQHDPSITAAMEKIGGFNFEQFLTEPLLLHHSDRDYYSPPTWNEDLVRRINNHGGNARDFVYRGNTHGLRVSKHAWFSPTGTIEGFDLMLARDIALMSGHDSDQLLIEALRDLASRAEPNVQHEYDREPLGSIKREVIRYQSDNLTQFALVLTPGGEPPASGWPVLIANHGYHPDPPNNGKLADGSTDRPGDYYRDIPTAFAEQGFLVVWPDFRGHNLSEGSGYTGSILSASWYTRDVLALHNGLSTLTNADLNNVFMWGHSMGGGITIRAVLALGKEIRAASVWSSGIDVMNELALQTELEGLEVPIIIQHSKGDQSTSYARSEQLARQLSQSGKPTEFHRHESNDHLFSGETLQTAIDKDISFFKRFMTEAEVNQE